MKTPSVAAEISSTVDIKPQTKSVNGELALSANSQPTDLRFNMYSDKKPDVKPIFQNNADPYIGSVVQTETQPANGENLAKVEAPNADSAVPFVSTTASAPQTNDLIAAAFSSYFNTTESQALVSTESQSINSSNITRNRPGSGPPLKYNSESLAPAASYRSSSANLFSTMNRGPNSELRGSPNLIQHSNNYLPGKIPSPLSPASQNASPAERPHSTALVSTAPDYTATSSAFKPLPASQANQAQQVYPHHTPSPHSYHHGPSPPLAGW